MDEYVRDSAEDPAESFGPPGEYAEQIVAAAGPVPAAPSVPVSRALLTAAVSTAGTLLTVEGVVGLLRARSAPLTAGVLVAVVAVALLEVGAGGLVRRPAPLGCIAALVATTGGLLTQAVVLVGFRAPVLADLPAVLGTVGGLGLLAISSLATRSWVDAALPEPVADPRPGDHRVDPTVWDTVERQALVRRTNWGSIVFVALEIAVLTGVVLLLR